MKKLTLSLAIFFVVLFIFANEANAGWVNGYFRSDGTWVNGYYRTEPNYYKWDNQSWNGGWSDAYNDKSWYRDFGYDPEPWDNEIPNYSYWNRSSLTLPSYNYGLGDYSYSDNLYDSYDFDDYDYSYDSSDLNSYLDNNEIFNSLDSGYYGLYDTHDSYWGW